jgi:HK97 family phage major capsid protein
MDALEQLRSDLASKIEEARALLNRWEKEGRDPSEEETKTYDALLEAAESLKARIDRESRQRGFDRLANAVTNPPALAPLDGRHDDPGVLDLSPREVKRYSLFNALQATHEKDWRNAGFERECSLEIEKRTGRQPTGFFMPYDVLMAPQAVGRDILRAKLAQRWGMTDAELRVLEKSDQGSNLVATELDAAGFIDVLRNRTAVLAAGARMMTNLVGDQAIPRKTVTNAVTWLATEATDLTESDALEFDQVTMTPHTVGIRSDISRRMLKQGTPAAEQIVRDDIADLIALAIDQAAIRGDNVNEPQGIIGATGVGTVVIGVNGGDATWAHILEFESDVGSANALGGSMRWLVNTDVRAQWKTDVKVSGEGVGFLWEIGTQFPGNTAQAGGGAGDGIVNGYPAIVTNQLLSNIAKGTSTNLNQVVFGNFDDLIIGMWGVLDLFVDPYTQGDRGALVIRGFQDVDVAIRRGASFSTSSDIGGINTA